MKRLFVTREKHRSGESGVGMKLVGGKLTPSGETGAFVGKIYKGGVIDLLGQLKEGDEIVEWNGTCLRGKTYEEVQKILSESTQEIEILADCGPKTPPVSTSPAKASAAPKLDRSSSGSPQVTCGSRGRRSLPRVPGETAEGGPARRSRSVRKTDTVYDTNGNPVEAKLSRAGNPVEAKLSRAGNGTLDEDDDRRENNSSIDPMDSVSNLRP
ncbi:regulating synaptic membrane exocytosis protein 1-like, partial [Pollicipes pollicipes]|uniref:regulating synaptic membrane exocytosis protein 1-like n=1 Tax=Pollicipes pollicipes TaxID=41117 RepID=UPI00188503F6